MRIDRPKYASIKNLLMHFSNVDRSMFQLKRRRSEHSSTSDEFKPSKTRRTSSHLLTQIISDPSDHQYDYSDNNYDDSSNDDNEPDDHDSNPDDYDNNLDDDDKHVNLYLHDDDGNDDDHDDDDDDNDDDDDDDVTYRCKQPLTLRWI